MESDESKSVPCPICNKPVDTLRARAVGIFYGRTHYFCSAECKVQFKDPRRMPRDPGEPAGGAAAALRGTVGGPDENKPAREPTPSGAMQHMEMSPSVETFVGSEASSKPTPWMLIIGVVIAVAGLVFWLAMRAH